MKTVLGLLITLTFSGTVAKAECYGVYSQNEWKSECGKVPAPANKYTRPTADLSLNQNDKNYLCSLVQLSEPQCTDVQFSIGAGGNFGEAGIVQAGFDVAMKYNGKKCFGAIWKTHKSDNTWTLSSPTSIFAFPYDCQIP